MKITRRCFFLVLCFFLAILPAFPQTPANKKFLVFVGTYTDKTDSKGIYLYEFDTETGKLSPEGLAAESVNPSFLAVHPNGKYLYAVNEVDTNSYLGRKSGTVTAFSIEPTAGKLTLLNQLPSGSADPCYISFDKTGKVALVANYTGGSIISFPVLSDGRLGTSPSHFRHTGSSANKERQEAPHAHWIETSPDNRFVLVADLGLDEIVFYRLFVQTGILAESTPYFAKLAAGAGPRHAAFSPDGRFVYVLSELNSTVTVFAYKEASGTFNLKKLQVLSTLPKDFHGRNEPAEIAVHSDGKWLFASNRGHDTIAVFAVDPASGTLRPAGEYPTGGKEPRHFAIDPTGHFLLAENQNSNFIVVFRINPASGALTEVSVTDGVPSPVCLVFLGTP